MEGDTDGKLMDNVSQNVVFYAMSSFSFLKQPCLKTHPWLWKSCLFEKGQIIGTHQAEKTSKEIAETTKTGLRTVQCIINKWKDSGKPPSYRKTCG